MTDAAPAQGAPEPEGDVRARLVELVATLLPALDPVPPRLRRIASFAPARRARLGGEQILAALADDDALRDRVAALAGSDDGATRGPEEAEDPATVAARAWLVRDEGWEAVWASATAEVAERHRRVAADREYADVRRAQERADRAQAALEEQRADSRRRTDELREEVAVLRRRLGESRAREREARAEAEEARASSSAVLGRAEEARAEAEAERRRLRGRIEELEEANAALRRVERGDREEVGTRVRVLLDTVVEAAAGLRRELVLPTAAGSTAGPGARVEQALGDRAAGPADAGPVREGAAALEHYLAAPRSRLLVDGYNVSKTAWPEATLEDQRTRLLRLLAPVVARTGAETTVVFDAAATRARPVVPAPRGVRVLFSPHGVIADDVIAELVEAEPEGRPVVVVSSDAEVARHATRHAARAVASTSLLALLA